MTTKNDERKALQQIKAIVAALGEDSYLATAFEGVFDDANQNIEYDAAFSYKSRYEAAQKEIVILKADSKEASGIYNATAAALDMANEEIGRLAVSKKELSEKYNNLVAANINLGKELDAARAEVINLKAKLYDYMVAGA